MNLSFNRLIYDHPQSSIALSNQSSTSTMPTMSKPKSRTMTSGRSALGRVFCVTGLQNQSTNLDHSTTPNLIGVEYDTTNRIGQSDSDSNTSGYISSSSFESSGEEKRLIPNGQKVFSVWSKWGEQVQIPKSSTPKQGSWAYKKRIHFSTESGKSLLSIKKNLGDKSKRTDACISKNTDNQAADSFWDIETPKMCKSNSEGDVRNSVANTANSWKCKPVNHDAGQGIDVNNKMYSKSRDWKRRPFLTQSDSQLELRMSTNDSANKRNSDNASGYSALPRYRVKIDNDPVVSKTKLAQQLSKSCADFADEGVPVDESMSEFLSNVDRENLASFLSFYDRMTTSSAYETARRNSNNYEAVYY